LRAEGWRVGGGLGHCLPGVRRRLRWKASVTGASLGFPQSRHVNPTEATDLDHVTGVFWSGLTSPGMP